MNLWDGVSFWDSRSGDFFMSNSRETRGEVTI